MHKLIEWKLVKYTEGKEYELTPRGYIAQTIMCALVSAITVIMVGIFR